MSGIASFTDEAALGERQLRDTSRPTPEKKKRIIITGGSGKLGRWVVREMVDHGWEVYNIDVVAPAPSEVDVKAKYMYGDLKDYGQVVALLSEVDSVYRGVDAVIHIAAIPAPAKSANHVVFHTNILQTYNILEACRVLRIKNVALASSETVFGLPLHPHKPTKLPVSEEVERPESSYSLSKLMGEKMAEQYCRWDPETKIINIRLSNVMAPEDYKRFPGWQDDPWSRAWNGFCYIDARDCAQAFRLSIESQLKGAHVFHIANADTAFKESTSDLVKKVFPDIPYTPDTDNPREGLISIKKARDMLGFNPIHEWQDQTLQ